MITNINADIIIAAVQSTTEIRACHTTSSGYSSRSELRNLTRAYHRRWKHRLIYVTHIST